MPHTNFVELRLAELRRISLPRRWVNKGTQKGRGYDVGPRPFPSQTVALCEDASLQVITPSMQLRAYRVAGPPGTNLPARTLAVACTKSLAAACVIAVGTRNERTTALTASRTISATAAGLCAGAVAEPDVTSWTTKAVGAVAATARSAAGAGYAIGCAPGRRARRGRGSGSRRGGSGGLRLAGSARAVTATALIVPRAVLAVALAAYRVGRCLTTDAERSKRAPDDGSTHQPERLASREGAIGQSSSEIVEEAIFSCQRLPLPRKARLVSPAELRNVAKYEGLQGLAQLPRIPSMRSSARSAASSDASRGGHNTRGRYYRVLMYSFHTSP